MPLHAAADTICGYIYSASERYTYVTKAHEQKSAFNLRTKQKQSARVRKKTTTTTAR